MYFNTPKEWLNSSRKRILLFGMSGVGKTHIARLLRSDGNWYHYSVDYRIGTRYLGEFIVDNFKIEAMKNEFLAKLLMSDSIYIGSNISFNNLFPLSSYIGKIGSEKLGGLNLEEFEKRQEVHRVGEIRALEDSTRFIKRASEIYGYNNFVCDTGGSICEVIDPYNKDDKLMNDLSKELLPVWIKSNPDLDQELLNRFLQNPKPMYYQPEFLKRHLTNTDVENLNPDEFSKKLYKELIIHRLPRYQAMADKWGVTVESNNAADLKNAEGFYQLIAKAIQEKSKN